MSQRTLSIIYIEISNIIKKKLLQDDTGIIFIIKFIFE